MKNIKKIISVLLAFALVINIFSLSIGLSAENVNTNAIISNAAKVLLSQIESGNLNGEAEWSIKMGSSVEGLQNISASPTTLKASLGDGWFNGEPNPSHNSYYAYKSGVTKSCFSAYESGDFDPFEAYGDGLSDSGLLFSTNYNFSGNYVSFSYTASQNGTINITDPNGNKIASVHKIGAVSTTNSLKCHGSYNVFGDNTDGAEFAIYKNNVKIWPKDSEWYTFKSSEPSIAFPNLSNISVNKDDTINFVFHRSTVAVIAFNPQIEYIDSSENISSNASDSLSEELSLNSGNGSGDWSIKQGSSIYDLKNVSNFSRLDFKTPLDNIGGWFDATSSLVKEGHLSYYRDGYPTYQAYITAYKSGDFDNLSGHGNEAVPDKGVIFSFGYNNSYVSLTYTVPKDGTIKVSDPKNGKIASVWSIGNVNGTGSLNRDPMGAYESGNGNGCDFAIYKNNVKIWPENAEYYSFNISNTSTDFPKIDALNVLQDDEISFVFRESGVAVIAFNPQVDYIETDESHSNAIIGDISFDDEVNMLDLIFIKNHLLNNVSLKKRYDINCDGVYNILDFLRLRKYLFGSVSVLSGRDLPTKEEMHLYVPTSVTLSLYDENSYGVTWNTEGKPYDPVVQVTKGEQFDAENCENFEVEFKLYDTYNTDDTSKGYYISKAVITGLEKGETYSYRCYDKTLNLSSDVFTFTAGSLSENSFKFLHVSDSQVDATSLATKLIEDTGKPYANTLNGVNLNGFNPDFILHTGDIVEWSKYESYWENMLHYNKQYFAQIPTLALAGNHEGDYRNGQYELFKHFNYNIPKQNTSTGIYYYYDYGNTRFIMLNTNATASNKLANDQYNWLVSALESNNKKWTIVSMHNPIYSVGKWGSASDYNAKSLALREQLGDLFAEYGVDLVLQGHDHTYSKTYPIAANGIADTSPSYELINGINYSVDPSGVIYAMHGASGNQSRSPVITDSSIYEKSGAGYESSWAQIEVSDNLLTVKVYYYNNGAPTLWNSYGIKKN